MEKARTAREDLSPVTAQRYESVWNVHIRKSIGKERIATLTPYDIKRGLSGASSRGAPGVKTVRFVRSMLNRACRLARKWSANKLPNPVADTELPKWKLTQTPEPVRAPTPEEVWRLLAAARALDPRYSAVLRVVAATGARRGEACALRWSDVDWDDGRLTIDESVIASAGGASVKAPKTRTSIRRVAIDAGTLAELESLKAVQLRLATDAGVKLTDDSFVFSAEPGGSTPPLPGRRDPRLHQGEEGGSAALRHPPAFASSLSGHVARHRDPRAPEAGPDGLVDGSHGSPLHRLHRQRGPPSGAHIGTLLDDNP